MNNYQDILESYDKIYNLTVIYTGEEIKHVYKKVDVTYKDAGIPYIETSALSTLSSINELS